jgi:putative oxidoreductase
MPSMLSEIGFIQVLLVAALIAAAYGVRKSLSRSALCGSNGESASPSRHMWHRLLLEFTELLLAAVFFLVGGAKLIGRADMIALFRDVGLGQWFRYVTGTVEVTGAALLIVPLLSGISAFVLGGVMVVAALIELFVLHRPPVAALACLGAHTFVAWARMSHGQGSDEMTAVVQARPALHRSMEARWSFPRKARGLRVLRQGPLALDATSTAMAEFADRLICAVPLAVTESVVPTQPAALRPPVNTSQ